jgi:prepilin-type N-terminal cleavage/methylation domain-containing protein
MRRGMTLFEMLMVLVIVVGLLAIGVPGLVIVNNGQRVNNAANSLAAALSQARARAIFDKRPHGIRLIATDPDNPESNKPSPPVVRHHRVRLSSGANAGLCRVSSSRSEIQ